MNQIFYKCKELQQIVQRLLYWPAWDHGAALAALNPITLKPKKLKQISFGAILNLCKINVNLIKAGYGFKIFG
ncbi:MAG TPA: hypothetical protein PLA77_10880 [Bacteroidales bacterium]|nr:hypothetical protein [Bacteroidales bacterium]